MIMQGQIQRPSNTNLDEYINFFDSSVVMIKNSNSDMKCDEGSNDVRSMDDIHINDRDEHTTTKKNQNKNMTALNGGNFTANGIAGCENGSSSNFNQQNN